MSALVIIECNVCGAFTPPWPTAERAREEVAPERWLVDVDGENVDYCPKCTAPVGPGRVSDDSKSLVLNVPAASPVSRLDVARNGITQLRDALATMVLAHEVHPVGVRAVAYLAHQRAEELLTELAP